MNALIPLIAVIVLFLVGWLGTDQAGLYVLFGAAIPYIAIVVFFCGLVYRVVRWAASPVPFRIPTTCGQQKSLDWIRPNPVDNPYTLFGVLVRMALEILFFRSLLRNTKTELKSGPRVVYSSNIWLWLGAMAFHWSFLVILIRHMRFFTEPVPFFVTFLHQADGFFQVGVPIFYATSFILLAALSYLLLRRLFSPQLRYISLVNDYFPLFLLIGIGLSGFWLRYITKTDIVAVKELALGLVSFTPTFPESVSPLFYGHLFLVCTLFIYFPFSKLMHMAGVFLSPTRNLANNNRMVRHINPWNYPVKVHTYEEYEDDFREKMKKAGIVVEKE
ncbi:MAG: sulfate reduction electron transfer complex DsrMKJOP subunit DsrM [Deltaproteobacteria bacterium]|nr:sulfate reduction electron transfer complex DsrMKJOP subunit DsrM [Deltaproteobacteria bacterium]